MLPCLSDAYYPRVGKATVTLLEKCGYNVHFPKQQTCCGQPPYNSGDWNSAVRIAEHQMRVLEAAGHPVVIPSASCTAMIREGYQRLGLLTTVDYFELAEFLNLHWREYPTAIRQSQRVAFHRSCHSRGLSNEAASVELFMHRFGYDLLHFSQDDQCCGFGGSFCLTHPCTSEEIGLQKLRCVMESGATTLTSGDTGCLMHLEGLALRHKVEMRFCHWAQLIVEAWA